LYFILVSSNDRFRPIALKAFQQKIKQAEDMATKLLLPGAHSDHPGEEGEQLLPWVEIFHRYFELKKNQVTKSAAQEQLCVQIQMMQNTILPPPKPLGTEDATAELLSEVATVRNSNLPLVNSSIRSGGTLILIPISTATSNNNRNFRHMVSNVPSTNNVNGAACSIGDILSLVEMMNQNTRVMFHCPFAEVQRDYKTSMLALERARGDNDDSRVKFYELAVHNLFKELQSLDT
jgi:hypothetical protein